MQRIHILGGGALGCMLSHELQARGVPVTLLLRSAATKRGSITLETARNGVVGKQEVDIEASDGLSGGLIDKLVVTSKAFDIKPALHALRSRLSATSGVILLHNGMLTEPLSSLVPFVAPENVYCGITLHAAYVTERPPEARVVWAGQGHLTLGPMTDGGTPSEHITALVEALVACTSLQAKAVDYREVQVAQRLKLALNAGSNPITGLMNMRNGETVVMPAFREASRLLCEESAAVFEAERVATGMSATPDPRLTAEALLQAVINGLTATGPNFSSTLMDIRLGRAPEIPYINGAIADLGRKYGVPTPAHDFVGHLVALRSQLGNSAYRF